MFDVFCICGFSHEITETRLVEPTELYEMKEKFERELARKIEIVNKLEDRIQVLETESLRKSEAIKLANQKTSKLESLNDSIGT